MPLTTLENKIPLKEFDVVGFSLSYELSYTNVLNMLELAQIPLLRRERGDEHPLVIAGGLCCLNPEPMSDFFDAFLIGDGEEAIIEIVDACIENKGQETRDKGQRKWRKGRILEKLSGIEGVYVPGISKSVRKRIVEDLDAAYFPTDFVVPNIEVIHDRLTVEIMRGCPFRCNFCQARVGYHPNRSRSVENIIKLIEQGIRNTGYDEVSLLSLSSANHPQLLELIERLTPTLKKYGVSISLPSLRIGSVTKELPALLSKIKKTGLTLAPEAGSERLRKLMNKAIEMDSLYEVLRNALKCGYRRMKLYFMMGLPTEERADLDGIVEIIDGARREVNALRARADIVVSISSFIPKPHTAFERDGSSSMDELREKRAYLLGRIKRGAVKVSFHDERRSLLEAVLSRGDSKIGEVIYDAHKNGARFDSWTEHFNFAIWMEAFGRVGIDPTYYANRKIAAEEALPWHYVLC